MALELELEGEHVRLLRTVEQVLDKQSSHFGRPLPVNVDGACAVDGVCVLPVPCGSAAAASPAPSTSKGVILVRRFMWLFLLCGPAGA